MKGAKLLRLLLTQYAWAIANPIVAKAALLCSKSCKDEFVQRLVRALVVSSGDWRAAAEFVEAESPRDIQRLRDFRDWAETITAPRRRGLLLEWKGGVS